MSGLIYHNDITSWWSIFKFDLFVYEYFSNLFWFTAPFKNEKNLAAPLPG